MRKLSHLIIVASLFVPLATAAEQETGSLKEPASSLAKDAQQVLEKRCQKCHGARKKSGKLDVRNTTSLLLGGKRGPAIIPGDSAASRLIELLQPNAKPHMPPGKKQLKAHEIELLTSWIDSLEPATPPGDPPGDHWEKDAATKEEPQEATKSWSPPSGVNPTTVIDLLVEAGYTKRSVQPNAVCTDRQFVRRVYLDAVGRIPTQAETQVFLTETDSSKRSKLIEKLLATDEHAQHMAEMFDTMLLGRSEKRRGERQSRGWMRYLTDVFKDNRPWDEVASEMLLARAVSKDDRGHIWYLHERDNKHQDIAEAVSKHFFGVDISCAQCHDHPLAGEIEQSHYWGLVAFFNRSKNVGAENGFAVGESAIGGFNDFANALEGTTEQSSLVFLHAKTIAEARPKKGEKPEDKDELYVAVSNEPRIPKFSRREKFVDEVLKNHPLLARAMVNRIWATLMGRGIVHPAEKMDSDHPPSHPALLDWLAQDFRESGYDIRRLVGSVLKSRAYQLDSRTSEGTPQPDSFAYGLEKQLTAESYLRSMLTSLDLDRDDAETKKLLKAVSREFRKQFPDVLHENNLTKLNQTMMLSNSQKLQELFELSAKRTARADGIVEQIADLYQRIYHRAPTDDELFEVGDYLRNKPDREKALAQVLWAMLTSAEFRFNH